MSYESSVCNGPLVTGMYNVKPYYDNNVPLELPRCMYSLSSIYSGEVTQSPAGMTNVATEQSGTVNVKALEEWQERILARLHQLQMKVKKMTEEADMSKSIPQTSHKTPVESSLPSDSPEVISDIVINAHPSSPPLSVFVLYQMLARQKRVLMHSFVHSSVRDTAVPDLSTDLSCLVAPVANRNHFQLGLSVIWKDVKRDASLIVSPSKQTPVLGEVNIARYLARLLTPSYDADIVTATRIDSFLDHAAALIRSSGDTSGTLKIFSQQLSRKKWFVGSDVPSLADVVVWSSVKQCRLAATAPDNVRQWLARCDALPEFANAGRLLQL